MNRLMLIFCLAAVLLLAGCNLPDFTGDSGSTLSPPTPSAPPTNPVTPEPEANALSSDYPETPEGVVSAFLSAYTQDIEGMLAYLSPAALSSLPAAGPAALLDFDGALQGFLIQSASMMPEPPTALVVVAVDVEGVTGAREFLLSKSEDRWVIDSVMDPDR